MVLLGILIAIAAPISLSMALGGESADTAPQAGGGVVDDVDVDIPNDNPDISDFFDEGRVEPGGQEVVSLTEFFDMHTGTDADETIEGLGGIDDLNGGAGNDLIRTGSGSDIASGGEGNDELIGADGGDVLLGNEGHDTITGDAGIDALMGGQGDDLMDGGADDDVLLGGTGADTLMGGAGADTLAGIKLFTGEASMEALLDATLNPDVLEVADDNARDFLFGGEGDDDIAAGADDVVIGGAGADEFQVLGDDFRSSASKVTIIYDFEPGLDEISIVKQENAAFPEITIQPYGTDVLVLSDGMAVARVLNTTTNQLSISDITFSEPTV